MFEREVSAEYRGFRIVLQNSWGTGAVAALVSGGIGAARRALGDETRLLINGTIVASSTELILSSKSTLLLQACINADDNEQHLITVYAKSGWVKNLFKLCVDGERIAGDEF